MRNGAEIFHRGAVRSYPYNAAMSKITNRIYQSVVDAWLIGVLYAGPLLIAGLGFYLGSRERDDEALGCFGITIGLVIVNLLVTRPCRYTLTSDGLHIRCGIYHRMIELNRIRGAELTTSWRSAPALSLRRVRIKLDNGGDVLVSPLNRNQFIQDLLEASARCRDDEKNEAQPV